jgi:hypothetical protein
MDAIRRLHAEKQADLEPVQDGEHIVWGDLRTRRTMHGTTDSRDFGQHLPPGMAAFPNDSDDDEDDPHRGPTSGEPITNSGDISKGSWVTQETRLGLVRGSIYEQRKNGSQ